MRRVPAEALARRSRTASALGPPGTLSDPGPIGLERLALRGDEGGVSEPPERLHALLGELEELVRGVGLAAPHSG